VGSAAQLAHEHGRDGQERWDSEVAAAQIPGTAGVSLAPRSCH